MTLKPVCSPKFQGVIRAANPKLLPNGDLRIDLETVDIITDCILHISKGWRVSKGKLQPPSTLYKRAYYPVAWLLELWANDFPGAMGDDWGKAFPQVEWEAKTPPSLFDETSMTYPAS